MARHSKTLTGRRIEHRDINRMLERGVPEHEIDRAIEARAPYLGSPSYIRTRTSARPSRGSQRTRATGTRSERVREARRR